MKLKEIYKIAVHEGIVEDPRGKEEVDKFLEQEKKKFESLSEGKKKYYEKEALTNPYADTRILYNDEKKEIKKVLVGIDISVADLLLAKELERTGNGVDAVIAHHPAGVALAGLSEVMHLQADVIAKLGVPINVAESILQPRISEVSRSVAPINHNRSIDAATLLKIPFACFHTVADNHVQTYLQKIFDEKKPRTVEDVQERLLEIPEYQEAAKLKAGPALFCGRINSRAGKVFVDMTGGTEGSEKIYEELSRAGIGTIIAMHISEKLRAKAEKNHISVVVAGHIASDSLGLNLLFDKIENRGLEIIPFSGFIRVKRKK